MSFDAKFPWLSNKSKVNADGAAPDPSGSIEVDMLDPVAYIPVKQIDSFFPFYAPNILIVFGFFVSFVGAGPSVSPSLSASREGTDRPSDVVWKVRGDV